MGPEEDQTEIGWLGQVDWDSTHDHVWEDDE